MNSTSTMIQVTWVDPATEDAAVYRGELPISIGREPVNDIVLKSNRVSRTHARIERSNGSILLIDQQSRNGTRVGAERITQVVLQAGDSFQIGPFTFQVDLSDAEAGGDTGLNSQGADAGELAVDATLNFSQVGDALLPFTPPPRPEYAFPPAGLDQPEVSLQELEQTGLPISETTYLAIGGGLGSFVWVDHLLIFGVKPDQVAAIGLEAKPHGRYERLCRFSQIPQHERLRSNAESCPDNIWGWPGYASREVWQALRRGKLGDAVTIGWQVFGEPTLAQTYTPQAGNVFASIEREARRIGWEQIWRYGHVKAIRKTDDGRYVVAYSQTSADGERQHKLMLARYLHIAVGYPGVRFLPDLQAYREQTGDFQSVVNAYEDHEHVYEHLRAHGGTVLLRGRGIVASRIMQRLAEIRAQKPNINVLHLMRSPVAMGHQFKHARRTVEHHWEFQPFNWPKACWGGTLRKLLEDADDQQREELLNDWGGTTTARRKDWAQIVERGLREGWYQIRFGAVRQVERRQERLLTQLHGRGAIQDEAQLWADFIIDCTGLEAEIERNTLLKDLVERYDLERTLKRRLKVANDFEVVGMRNGAGRVYASGAMTLGGPTAPVDSFLGLQYAALRSVDALVAARAPGVRALNSLRSLTQWVRWAGGVHP